MIENSIDDEIPINDIARPIQVDSYPVPPPPTGSRRMVILPAFQPEERYGRYSYIAITSALIAIFLVYGMFFMPIYAIYPDYPYWVDNIVFLLMGIGWALGFVTMSMGVLANRRREKLGRLSIKLGLFVVCAPLILFILVFIAWMITWPPQ